MTGPRMGADPAGIGHEFAEEMRWTRLKARLRQADVADSMRALGFNTWSRVAVANVERGQRPVTIAEAHAIGSLLGFAITLGAVGSSSEGQMAEDSEDRSVQCADCRHERSRRWASATTRWCDQRCRKNGSFRDSVRRGFPLEWEKRESSSLPPRGYEGS